MHYNHTHNEQYKSAVTKTAPSGSAALTVTEDATFTAQISDEKEIQRTKVISVLLADDHALIREGIRQLFALEQDIHIAGEAVNGLEALQKTRQLRPDVVLMDIHMPIIDGIAVTRQITHEFPSIAVIILTVFRQNQQVLQAMKNGAKGYLLKNTSGHEVSQAIRTVYAGGMLIEPELTGTIIREFRRLSDSSTGNQRLDLLTEKEIEILRHVATGMNNKEIAERLAYSEKTVKNYLSTVFQKLQVRDRTQAAIFALRQGLLPDEELRL